MSDYQVIVIGSGPAGTAAAGQAAKLGLKTAVIESNRAGGTCLNRGCVPSKNLLHASGLVADFEREKSHGIIEGSAGVNLPALFAYKDEVCSKLSGQVEASFKTAHIDLIRGKATLLAGGRVRVEGNILTADSIILATGSVPAMPPIPGLDLPDVLMSDEVLAGADHLYRSLVIIGGGVIGIEFATFYSDLGVNVTIIEGMDRILPAVDKEISQNLTRILKKRGVTVFTKAMVTGVRSAGCGGAAGDPGSASGCPNGQSAGTDTPPGKVSESDSTGSERVTVTFSVGGKEQSVACEKVLCAVGRRPNTDGLFDEAIRKDLAMDGRRIQADSHFATSIPGVYAIGDVSSKIQLAHAATAQGIACVNSIAGQPSVYTADAVPACIFTRPEIAVVGLDEQGAKTAGIDVAVGKAVLFSNARTVIATDERCFIKVLARKDDQRIVGAQFMCERSSEMISEITEAIVNGLTVSQMLAVIRPHPTFHEALTDALRDLAGKLER